jgi:kynurenine formamidase
VDVLGKRGARKLGVQNAKDGIFTRGVLVDIPWLRGVEFLEPGTAITSEDLEAWEAKTKVKIGSVDVLLIRTGRWERLRQKGQWNFLAEAAGSHASVARWLKARDVAVIGSDGVSDVIPSGVEGLVNPLHELVLVRLGMPLLDNLDLDPLARHARQRGRRTFLFVGLPLRVPGGTGSPLNPLAISERRHLGGAARRLRPPAGRVSLTSPIPAGFPRRPSHPPTAARRHARGNPRTSDLPTVRLFQNQFPSVLCADHGAILTPVFIALHLRLVGTFRLLKQRVSLLDVRFISARLCVRERVSQCAQYPIRPPRAASLPCVVSSFGELDGSMHPHRYVRLPNGHVLATFSIAAVTDPEQSGADSWMSPRMVR